MVRRTLPGLKYLQECATDGATVASRPMSDRQERAIRKERVVLKTLTGRAGEQIVEQAARV